MASDRDTLTPKVAFLTNDELDAILQRREIDGVEAIEHLTEDRTRLALAELRTLREYMEQLSNMSKGYREAGDE